MNFRTVFRLWVGSHAMLLLPLFSALKFLRNQPGSDDGLLSSIVGGSTGLVALLSPRFTARAERGKRPKVLREPFFDFAVTDGTTAVYTNPVLT